MIYQVRHLTTVDYAAPVRLARFNLRLKPAAWSGQVMTDYTLAIDPVPWSIQNETGPWIVNRSRLFVRDPLTRLRIESSFRMEVAAPGFDLGSVMAPTVADVRQLAATHRDLSATGPASYLYPSIMAPVSAEIAAWAAPHLRADMSVVDAGRALMGAIFREFRYDGAATTADTLPDESFRARHGVCQDFAHVMIVAARAHGVPAAYVSGYLRTVPPPGKPRLVGADATHAWAALWCGEALGWIGFDPTNDRIVAEDHIFTAMGRDYADVAPLDGVFHGAGGQRMTVAVDVNPLAA